MLDLNKSTLIETYVGDTHSTSGMIEEGSALVNVLEGGLGKVKVSAGVANESFAGISFGRSTTPTQVPVFETKAVPAATAYTVTLSKTPLGALGIVAVAANGTRTVLTSGAATNANEYSIANGVVTVNVAHASKTLELSYTASITYAEALMRYNFNSFTTHGIADIGVTGVLTTGIAFISNYDPTSDWSTWSAAVPVKTGANGTFTLGGSGTSLPSVVVVAIPSLGGALLGLRLNGASQ